MTATNHAATGAVLALAVQHPIIAFPLALASHFMLDVLPHYGVAYDKRPQNQKFGRVLAVDAIMLPITAIMLLFIAGAAWWFVLIAMFLAICPDFVWAYRYWREKGGVVLEKNRFTHWHSRIQWGERPWGWIIELAWFGMIIGVALQLAVTKFFS
jgi:hypothetical protein